MTQAQGADPAKPLTAAQRVDRRRVLVIAHRGDSSVAPENTLPAFASAAKAGADLVELDSFELADGTLLVIHDSTLDRTTDASNRWGTRKIPFAAKSMAELRELDAGGWFSPRFAGTRLPTLDEALDTIQPGSATLIEQKSGAPARYVDLLARKKMLDQVVVQSFDWKFLAQCHHLAPELTLAATGDKELSDSRLEEAATTGAHIVAWHAKSVDRDDIERVHRRGWKLWVWTVDDPARWQELTDQGIDGIITNRLSQLRSAVPVGKR